MCSVELSELLPHLAGLLVFSAETSGPVVVIEARTRSRVPVGCSGCGVLSDWIHSRYVRHLADTALGGRPVRIDLSVRRLYCENPSCPKATFAEQVPGSPSATSGERRCCSTWSSRSVLCWRAGAGPGCCGS
ncbi:transposase family protein [Streptomyces sp. NPDC003042]